VAPLTLEQLQAQIQALTDRLSDTTDRTDKERLRLEIGGIQDAINELEGFDGSLKRTLKTFTGITDASDTFAGSMLKLAGETDGLAKIQAQAEEVFRNTFTTLNVGMNILRKVGESTLALAIANDKAVASFNRSTGAAGAYNAELIALERTNRENGISTQALGESYSALTQNLSGFGVMAGSERARLGELGAQFAMVGISGADFAGTLETMTRGFGMSTQAATGMQHEAMALAQTLGKDVGQVLSEMNQALPQLASYGDDAVDMFFELEKQAQRTGLAVGELIDIAGQYRTFDSAASAAGNLNAVLGTQLFSSMGLLEAQLEGPEAVIEYMSENLANSIGDWNTLNTFQKDAVANAAGMNVEQMNQLMNQKAQTAEDEERAKSLEETMEAGRSLWDEMSIAVKSFAISVTPIVTWLTKGLSKINKLVSHMREEWGLIGKAIKWAFLTTTIVKFAGAIWAVVKAVQSLAIAESVRSAFSGPAGWAKLAVGGAIAGGAIAGIKALMPEEGPSFDNGGGVGGTGPTPATVHGGEAVVPIQRTPAAENLATMVAERSGGNNASVVSAVQALGSKLDAVVDALNASGDFVMNVDGREFGRVINKHLGEPGYKKLDIRTT